MRYFTCQLQAFFWVGLFAATACTTPNKPGRITGTVTDETLKPLAGVQVTLESHKETATTDSSGAFSFVANDKPGARVALSARAEGFARGAGFAVISAQPLPSMRIVLRKIGHSEIVQLPEGAAAAVDVTVVKGDSSTRLSIPADSLMRADGTRARGAAQVRMTFWNPNEDLTSAPPLYAQDGDARLFRLLSYGMADIEVEQNGELLQVAPGKRLGWRVALPMPMRANLTTFPQIAADIELYYLEPTKSVWLREPREITQVSYDTQTGIVTGQLPHLSDWNFDAQCYFPGTACNSLIYGGCVTGRVTDCNGAPLAQQPVRVWGLSQDALKDWNTTSDASGTYCQDIGMHDTIGGTTVMGYHLSSPLSDTDSNYPSPLNPATRGSNCGVCLASHEPIMCNGCEYGTVDSIVTDPATGAQSVGINWQGVKPLFATLTQGTFCAQRNCTVVPDLRLGSSCMGQGACLQKRMGSSCEPPGECCEPGTVCSDFVCVPDADP